MFFSSIISHWRRHLVSDFLESWPRPFSASSTWLSFHCSFTFGSSEWRLWIQCGLKIHLRKRQLQTPPQKSWAGTFSVNSHTRPPNCLPGQGLGSMSLFWIPWLCLCLSQLLHVRAAVDVSSPFCLSQPALASLLNVWELHRLQRATVSAIGQAPRVPCATLGAGLQAPPHAPVLTTSSLRQHEVQQDSLCTPGLNLLLV